VLHIVLNAVLSPVLLILVLRELTVLAGLILLISKWRTIAIKPRYWFANIRANAVDIIVGFSVLLFMHDSRLAAAEDTRFFVVMVAWAVAYSVWLLYVKPKSSEIWVSLQAGAAMVLGLSALFLYSDSVPETGLVLLAWLIATASARHFLSSYEEPYINSISMLWGFFVAQIAWLLNRWLIVYEIADVIRIPQISLLMVLAGYSVAELYHLAKTGKLTIRRRQQIILFGASLMVLVIVLSDWDGNV